MTQRELAVLIRTVQRRNAGENGPKTACTRRRVACLLTQPYPASLQRGWVWSAPAASAGAPGGGGDGDDADEDMENAMMMEEIEQQEIYNRENEEIGVVEDNDSIYDEGELADYDIAIDEIQ